VRGGLRIKKRFAKRPRPSNTDLEPTQTARRESDGKTGNVKKKLERRGLKRTPTEPEVESLPAERRLKKENVECHAGSGGTRTGKGGKRVLQMGS